MVIMKTSSRFMDGMKGIHQNNNRSTVNVYNTD